MKNDSYYLDRGPGELALFAIVFVGLVLMTAGVVTRIPGVAFGGFALAFLGKACFLIGNYLSEN